MARIQKIVPNLWFDTEAEDAASFYISIFPDSRITKIVTYPEAGQEIHGKPAGSVLSVAFELGGIQLTAINGGPQFKFTEAISLEILCDSQGELDHYWKNLSAGGEPANCGWLKDQFGLWWQVVPTRLDEMLSDPDPAVCARVTEAFLGMKKLDLRVLEQVYQGG